MSWGEIKKALNNTLGTPSFKPLDVLINDAKNEIKEMLSGELIQKNVYMLIPAYTSAQPTRTVTQQINGISKIKFAVAYAATYQNGQLIRIFGDFPSTLAQTGIDISISGNTVSLTTNAQVTSALQAIVFVYGEE